jgi:hypothetical protein
MSMIPERRLCAIFIDNLFIDNLVRRWLPRLGSVCVPRQHQFMLSGLLLLGCSIGCEHAHVPEGSEPAGRSQVAGIESGSGHGGDPSARAEPKQYSTGQLKPVEFGLPPLDSGRVLIPVPADWSISPRRSEYLVRFFFKLRSSPPWITVTVAESDEIDLDSPTVADLHPLLLAISELIDDSLLDGESLLEECQAVTLGDQPWIRSVRGGKLSNRSVERQILKTVHDGRIYTVELVVNPDKLLDSRDYAYAVAANMEFTHVPTEPAGAADDELLPDELLPDELPTEGSPAEDEPA